MGLRFTIFFFFAALISTTLGDAERKHELSWAVCYTNNFTVADLDDYNYLILDTEAVKDLTALQAPNRKLIAYISLGEVVKDVGYYNEASKRGILIGHNPKWNSYLIDIRRPEWQSQVINKIIPEIMLKGYNGIFIDTIDSSIHLEKTDPAAFKGAIDASVSLIKKIRRSYPSLIIVLNRGFDILDKVANDVDVVLLESSFSKYSFENSIYEKAPKHEYSYYIAKVNTARRINPSLKFFSLDYWNPADKTNIKKIYNYQRGKGFYPYVSTINLDRIIKEPK